jgi:hypothetical protein
MPRQVIKMVYKEEDQVQIVSRHWARPNQIGTIKEISQQAGGKYLVEFSREGIGFDGGKFLFLDEKNFELCQNS